MHRWRHCSFFIDALCYRRSHVGPSPGAVMTDYFSQIERDGFALLPAVFHPAHVEQLIRELTDVLGAPSDAAAIRSDAGNVYAARNLFQLWPEAAAVWR